MKSTHIVMEMRGVTAFYNGKPVLHDLNCEFEGNKITSIIGPSGSGKSTLLRALCRMNDRVEGFALQGEVRVFGQDIYTKNVDVYELRRKVGLIFQKPCVFPRSILENVLFGIESRGRSRKQKLETAEKALLEACLWDEVRDRLDHPAPTLSQGQQQRLSIARTLAVEPEALLMDEPTSSLDPKTSRGIEDMIISLKKRRTIILVTHDMEQAKRISDDVVCICDGKLYDTGTFAERFEKPERENIPQCSESSTRTQDPETSFESLEFYKKPPE